MLYVSARLRLAIQSKVTQHRISPPDHSCTKQQDHNQYLQAQVFTFTYDTQQDLSSRNAEGHNYAIQHMSWVDSQATRHVR